jgi:hypothetical protein
MKRLLTSILLLLSISAIADMPGNKPRPSGSFMVVNCSAFPGFRFTLSPSYGDTIYQLTDSLSIQMPGGRGAPIFFSFQVSRTGSEKIYTIEQFSSVRGNVVLRIDSLVNDSVVMFTRLDSSSKKNNGFGVTDAHEPLSPVMMLLPVFSAFAIIVLLVLWVRRRYLRSGEVLI